MTNILGFGGGVTGQDGGEAAGRLEERLING